MPWREGGQEVPSYLFCADGLRRRDLAGAENRRRLVGETKARIRHSSNDGFSREVLARDYTGRRIRDHAVTAGPTCTIMDLAQMLQVHSNTQPYSALMREVEFGRQVLRCQSGAEDTKSETGLLQPHREPRAEREMHCLDRLG